MATKSVAAILLVLCLIGGHASAAVVEVTPVGFGVRAELVSAAPPKSVYRALLYQIDKWWNPKHTYSGNSRNLSIDSKIGGCFCEQMGKGSGVEHARIIYLIPDALVRMSGALGPLQSSGLVGTLTWKLSAAGTGTKIELTYNVGGYMHGAFENIAPEVDEVLGDQLDRLKSFSETGKPN
jgi:hypothetical protein